MFKNYFKTSYGTVETEQEKLFDKLVNIEIDVKNLDKTKQRTFILADNLLIDDYLEETWSLWRLASEYEEYEGEAEEEHRKALEEVIDEQLFGALVMIEDIRTDYSEEFDEPEELKSAPVIFEQTSKLGTFKIKEHGDCVIFSIKKPAVDWTIDSIYTQTGSTPRAQFEKELGQISADEKNEFLTKQCYDFLQNHLFNFADPKTEKAL